MVMSPGICGLPNRHRGLDVDVEVAYILHCKVTLMVSKVKMSRDVPGRLYRNRAP